jgi:tetrapyrrole methylase family protein/MazG family protein
MNVSTLGSTHWVDMVCTAFKLDPLERGLQIADANRLAHYHFPQLDPDTPAIIARVSGALTSDCKRVLMVLYPPEHLITRLDAVGTSAQKIETVRLAELDQVTDFEGERIWFVPPLGAPQFAQCVG